MIILWIICIVAFIFMIKIFTVIMQRLTLYRKIKSVCNNKNYSLHIKHKITSIWSRSHGVDIEIKTPSKTYLIYIFTPIFKRFRYHFNYDSVEVIRGRRSMYIVNPKRPSSAATQTFITTFMKVKNFNFDGETTEKNCEKILLVHPLPYEITCTAENKAEYVHDGDSLWNTVSYYSAKAFQDLLYNE